MLLLYSHGSWIANGDMSNGDMSSGDMSSDDVLSDEVKVLQIVPNRRERMRGTQLVVLGGVQIFVSKKRFQMTYKK